MSLFPSLDTLLALYLRQAGGASFRQLVTQRLSRVGAVAGKRIALYGKQSAEHRIVIYSWRVLGVIPRKKKRGGQSLPLRPTQ